MNQKNTEQTKANCKNTKYIAEYIANQKKINLLQDKPE